MKTPPGYVVAKNCASCKYSDWTIELYVEGYVDCTRYRREVEHVMICNAYEERADVH